MMNPQHEPGPEFLERLEWQVRREMRRLDRFQARRAPLWRRKSLRTAALVVVSCLAGYAGATAAQDVSERRRLELLALQGRAELEIAELHLEFASDRLVEIERRVASGTVGSEQLDRAQFERDFLERDVAAARLDLEELEATGRPPRNDLGAPLVDGRDLVAERLLLHIGGLRGQRDHLTSEVERFSRGTAMGTVEPFEVQYRQAELGAVERSLAFARRSLELRASVVRNELAVAEAGARLELLRARDEADDARSDLEIARARVDRLAGVPGAGEMDRLGVDYELRIAEARVQMTEIRLRLLREEAGRQV